jgi:quinol monooxygenase YgiN
MAIVRLIFVNVSPDKVEEAERLWKHHCAPLMIQQPGCLSEKLLRSTDHIGEMISYSEWEDESSIEKYRSSAAHDEIKKHARAISGERPTIKKYDVGLTR